MDINSTFLNGELKEELVYTLLEQNSNLYIVDDTKEVNGTFYTKLVGSLNYLTTTRLDIAYSISILS
jgi:hypothetical protein